ncbi:MAG: aminotransferase class IV [Gemmatimonadetes bacterium]|nr:aminotransferase class IV [Gemmatimonadota bacterium]
MGHGDDAIVYFNGEYLPKGRVRISPDDRGFLLGDAAYEGLRTYGGRIFALDAHLRRLQRSLDELCITGVRADEFADVLPRLLELNGLAEGDAAKLYVQVTRGVAPRQHAFPDPAVRPTRYAAAGPLERKWEPAVGVSVITHADLRWSRCDIKAVGLLANVLANQRAREAGAMEAILVRDGLALECSSTSLFAIFDGEVRTAPVSNLILPGVTRGIVVELVREAGIPIREEAIPVSELRNADEVFITGTTPEVMPVLRIDGAPVRDGTPGPLTRRIYELFCRRAGAVAVG